LEINDTHVELMKRHEADNEKQGKIGECDGEIHRGGRI
jgi:hypothetical protein